MTNTNISDKTKQVLHNPQFSTDFETAAFLFILLPLDEAERRYNALEIPDKKPLNVEGGIDFGTVGQWSVFADYLPDYNQLFSGGFDFYEGDFPLLLKMAKEEEAVFAMYETNLCSGNLCAMKQGKIIRDFAYGYDEEYDRNIGQLPYEQERVENWTDITSFIDVLLEKNE
jgi:hypothetical protein